MNDTYWFITTFQMYDNNSDFGASRCWGFFKDKERALETLYNNITDLYENLYNYAVLEEYNEGLGNYVNNRQFFKYDKKRDGYFEVDEPWCMRAYRNFGIG